jgi:ATP-dependent Clp protease adaptor protein ClpS
MSAAPLTLPGTRERSETSSEEELDLPWDVIVWNDPVTLMTYVVYVLRKLFGHDEATAHRLMLQVHTEGRAIVSSGPREKAESDVARLHFHGLQATLEKAT